MMEQKLIQAAEKLPAPMGDYLTIEETVKKQRRRAAAKSKIWRRALITLTIVLILAGCTAAAANSEVHHGFYVDQWGMGWWEVCWELNGFDMELPKEIGGRRFYEAGHRFLCPPGTSYLEAAFSASYKPVHLDYVQLGKDENGNTVKQNAIGVNFGSTDNDLWMQYFSFNEDGTKIKDPDYIPGSYQAIEYEGLTLYTGSYAYDHYVDSIPIPSFHHWVSWVDEARGVCISMFLDGYDLETLIGYAEEIIDLNK